MLAAKAALAINYQWNDSRTRVGSSSDPHETNSMTKEKREKPAAAAVAVAAAGLSFLFSDESKAK